VGVPAALASPGGDVTPGDVGGSGPPSSPAYNRPTSEAYTAAHLRGRSAGAPPPPPSGDSRLPSPPPPPGPPGEPWEPGGRTPPPTVAGTGRGRGRLWLVLAAVAAVAVLGVGAFFLVGRDDDAASDGTGGGQDRPPTSATDATAAPETEPDGGGGRPDQALEPVAATRAYFEAVAAGDCAYIVDHSTPASWSTEGQSRDEALAECEADAAGTTGLEGLTVGDVTLVDQTDDRAVVRIDLTLAGQTETPELPVQLVDGVWLIDLAGAEGGFGRPG
jgi:hypothetical protein